MHWALLRVRIDAYEVAAAKSPLAESFIPHLAHWAL